jgi:hypothetical protein
MIVREFHETRFDKVNLYRTYSDAGYYILQNETGVKYSEAIDVEGKSYTYSETDELIPVEEEKDAYEKSLEEEDNINEQ